MTLFVDPITGRFRSPSYEEAEEYFWTQVDRSDPEACWPWRNGEFSGRYGQFAPKGLEFRSGLAHRWAYYFTHRQAPREVSHLCNNTQCVNPAHLVDSSRLENEQYKTASGRRPRGVKNLPCPKCGGPQEGRGRRGTPGKDGKPRFFAYCKPCKSAYEKQRRKK